MSDTKWPEVIENILQGSEIIVEPTLMPAKPGTISLAQEEQELLSNLILLALPSPSQHIH